MTGSGTDKTKAGFDLDGPVVILVEPQLGENIGMAARAMGNFALGRLRIVNPRDGWPNICRAARGGRRRPYPGPRRAVRHASSGGRRLDLLFATTARAHDQAKPVVGPEAAAREMSGQIAGGGTVGILFGRER